MKMSNGEPAYKFSYEEAAARSPLAADFIRKRDAGNASLLASDSKIVKRFFNLDHNAYMQGALDAPQKELIGLTASAVLRCDDCIFYHIIQAYRLGVSRELVDETLEISLVVGGSIVIPHFRRASLLLDELYTEH